jgi:putative PIN family toxin of toxin-antitoxin system
LRVVLDTNILVSAFNFPGGVPEAVFRLALEDRIDLVTSPPLLVELGRVLAEKFEWEPSRVEEAVAQVAESGIVVHPTQKVRVVRDDPTDDRVLEAAKEGGVDVIVSGDQHLLRLESWRDIRFVNASRFVAEFE